MAVPVYHIPALLNATIEGLNVRSGGVYVDCTFGGGGHAGEVLKRLGNNGKLLGFDQDEDAQKNIIKDDRFIFVHSNFKYLKNFLNFYGFEKVDGILADLGVSFHHFDEAERGFSHRYDSSLDMRMNKQSLLTAASVLNAYEENKLADVLYYYGELHNARKMARLIVNYREKDRFSSTYQLIEVLKPVLYKEKEKKDLTRVFQALRIEVNDEINVLKALLLQSVDVLNKDGRLVILTYHSLEDRLVKNFIRSGNFEGKLEKDFYGNVQTPLKAINTKVIVADEEEIAVNPRARSAKLRIATVNI